MKKEVLFTKNGIEVSSEKFVSEDVTEFLTKVIWGTQETKFQHHDTHERILKMQNPNFIVFRKEGQVIFTIMLSVRNCYSDEDKIDYFYARYFAVAPAYQGQGLPLKLGLQVWPTILDSLKKPTIFYGIIEEKNHPSWRIAEKFGFSKTHLFKTVGFSRFFPRKNKNIKRISEGEKPLIIEHLKAFYTGYSAAQFNKLFQNNDYYLLSNAKGEIIAGTQVYKVNWTVHEMPGIQGWLIQNIVPYIPLLRKIYNPKDFRFLSFEGLFYSDGNESKVNELIEGLLAEYGLNSAIFWLDEHSKIYKDVCLKQSLGLINHFVKNSNALIFSKAIGLSTEQEEKFKNQAMYLATFDML